MKTAVSALFIAAISSGLRRSALSLVRMIQPRCPIAGIHSSSFAFCGKCPSRCSTRSPPSRSARMASGTARRPRHRSMRKVKGSGGFKNLGAQGFVDEVLGHAELRDEDVARVARLESLRNLLDRDRRSKKHGPAKGHPRIDHDELRLVDRLRCADEWIELRSDTAHVVDTLQALVKGEAKLTSVLGRDVDELADPLDE